ncbi:hypothetical protein V6N11_042677 [Hibiscus sabdariffa]|uniref:Transmembrane protein n=1 Tax=Hibiscus sabdariffa TaxID=183260 RepID=A0ABR2QX03_9ROSI
MNQSRTDTEATDRKERERDWLTAFIYGVSDFWTTMHSCSREDLKGFVPVACICGALEELRSCHYNELRTSEGAKRQQQRFCKLVAAVSYIFFVSVGIILANKLELDSVSRFSRQCRSGFASLENYSFLLPLIFGSYNGFCLWPCQYGSTSLKFNSRAISFKKVLAGSWKTVPSNIWFAHPVILVMQVLALVVVSAGVAVATVTDLELNVFTSV